MYQAQKDNLQATTDWIQTCIPEPSNKDFHTQLGVFCEEVGEVLSEVACLDQDTVKLMTVACIAMETLGKHLKKSDDVIVVKEEDRELFLKELCDVVVTVATTAYSQKMFLVPAMQEVNRANYSKFVDKKPIFDENRKIVKGLHYKKADISFFV